MVRSLIHLFPALLITTGLLFEGGHMGAIAQSIDQSTKGYEYGTVDRQVTATVNRESFILIDLANQIPSDLFTDDEAEQGNAAAAFLQKYAFGIAVIHQVEDFDGDGLPDALVAFGTGGNCCAPGYAIISVFPDGSFRLTPLVDWSWNPPEWTLHNGEQVFETRTDNRVYIHAYRNGQVVLLDERVIQARTAIAQIRAEAVINHETSPWIQVDLNQDGAMETLNCRVWDRWQSLLCEVVDARGVVLQDLSQGCDRYGVLPTLTNGMHDIVCNEQLVARWNGSQYEWDQQ